MIPIRAIVIDDSAFMRKSISIMLESDGCIKVIGTAKDGEEGYKIVRSLKPDIVTLDIEMPKMDGLTALKNIMKDCPTSVIMISSLTTDGAEATLKALELPGLWNGSMARWITVFVETPLITFNPVKTINDLLRDEHQ